MMRPVITGIAGGLLLSLALVAGVTLVSSVSTPGTTASPPASDHAVTSRTSSEASTTSVVFGLANQNTSRTAATTTATKAGTTQSVFGAYNQTRTVATLPSAQASNSSVSALPTFLPIATALALGASAYLISRSRIEKEA